MVAPELAPQLRFLTDAAHLLSASAPETSAFLMSRRSSLLVENDVPVSEAQRQHVCSCCGHIMVPGQGSKLKFETDKALQVRTKRQPNAKGVSAATAGEKRCSRSGISKVFTCGNCGRYTKLSLPGPQPISRTSRTKALQKKTSGVTKAQGQVQSQVQNPVQVRGQAQVPQPEPEASKPASANANSKKRAKNRKAGLQALLDQRQGSTTPSSGFGLSLSDFMKK